MAELTQPGQPAQRISLPRRSLKDCLAEELRRLDPDEIFGEALSLIRATRRPIRQTGKAIVPPTIFWSFDVSTHRCHRPCGDGRQPRPQPGPERLHRCPAQPVRRKDRRPAGEARRGRRLRPHGDPAGARRLPGEAAPRADHGQGRQAGRRRDRRSSCRCWKPGDIIIDGGNSHYEDTRRREAALAEKGLHFVGIGVSGGEEGALQRPVDHARRLARSPTTRSARCWRRSPPRSTASPAAPGSAPTAPATSSRWSTTASSTPTCRSSARPTTCCAPAPASSRPSRPKIFAEWNKGDLASFLIEITAEVLGHMDAKTGKPFVDVIVDAAGQKGTGRWTVISALDLGSPISGIAESVFARGLSSQTEQREAGPGAARPAREADRRGRRESFVEDVRAGAVRVQAGLLRPGPGHAHRPPPRSTAGT